MIKIEVCSNSIASAIAAERGGAHRIELCDNLAEGGTTPSLGMLRYIKKQLKIETNILIRPRGGDFIYSDEEFDIMKEDIHICGNEGCNGIVVGILKKTGVIDNKRSSELIEIAKKYNMTATFHRAFDRVINQEQTLEDVIQLGCDRILTSGGRNTAIEGKDTLRKLIEIASDRIIIMPGGGVNPDNIGELIKTTNLKEVHGTFSSKIYSAMEHTNKGMTEEDVISVSDIQKIKRTCSNIGNS